VAKIIIQPSAIDPSTTDAGRIPARAVRAGAFRVPNLPRAFAARIAASVTTLLDTASDSRTTPLLCPQRANRMHDREYSDRWNFLDALFTERIFVGAVLEI
jgi:hypothetical protein